MSLDERVSDLIKRIYCASHDVEEWDSIATQLLDMVGGCFALTTVVDLSTRQFESYRFYGPGTSANARGVEEYAELYRSDPTLRFAAENPAARFCDSSETVVGDYLEDPFIQWNAARFGATHWYVGYTPPSEELSFSFSIHIPAATGAATGEQLSLFRMIFDHMECAVRLQRRPFKSESARALLVLDRTGLVRQVSKGGQMLFSRPGAIAIIGSRLICSCTREQARLDRALAEAANVVTTGVRPTAVKIESAHGNPWIVIVRPVLNSYGPFGNIEHQLHMEIHDGSPRVGSLDLIQSLFNLTARELQIVRLLADHHSVESLSELLHISPNTARTHLRAIFSKTATTRQSELMQLCSGLCPPDA